jgi:hypothetical protein
LMSLFVADGDRIWTDKCSKPFGKEIVSLRLRVISGNNIYFNTSPRIIFVAWLDMDRSKFSGFPTFLSVAQNHWLPFWVGLKYSKYP